MLRQLLNGMWVDGLPWIDGVSLYGGFCWFNKAFSQASMRISDEARGDRSA